METSKRIPRQVQLLVLHGTLLLFMQALLPAATASAQSIAVPGCQDRCGDVSIPYPFGIGTNCSRPHFNITCNSTGYDPPRPFMGNGNIRITNINLTEGQLRVKLYMAAECYNETYKVSGTTGSTNISTSYRFSNTHNKFIAVGCATLAYIEGVNAKADSYTSGCVSMCTGLNSISEGSCDGIGCCQTSIPKDLRHYKVKFGGYNHSDVWEFSPCSYAFLAEQSWFNFSVADLSRDFAANNENLVPVVIDWAIRDGSSPGDACRSKNSTHIDSENGPGYRCKCQQGYDGNPYLVDGCYDIDECRHPEIYRCDGTCHNKPGSYDCTCPHGMHGDGKKGTCTKPHESFPLSAKLAVGISGGIVILVIITSAIIMNCGIFRNVRISDS